MGIQERRLAEKELIRKKIFDAASDIIISEGFEKLSIRKIANKIEYSPGVIYNYFKDKEEIIKLIIAENIQRIYNSMEHLNLGDMEPKSAVEVGFKTLATAMLKNPQQYKAVMLSGINLSMFEEGTSEIGKLKQLLTNVLNNGKKLGIFDIENAEMTSIILTASMFGLINTLVQEQITDEKMQSIFIDKEIEILVSGITK